MKYRDRIIDYFDNIQEGTIVSANEMYGNGFEKMSQEAFFRAVERLSDEGMIVRVGKGLYIRKEDKDKNRAEILLNYFFGEDNSRGMFTGLHLYNKYSLTSVKSDSVKLYLDVCRGNVCHIGNITARRPGVELNFENTRVIEALEILQNYSEIPELDKTKFARYAKQFARGYNDEAAVTVIHSMKYKKRTIAFMKKILDTYKVTNTLSQFLSNASHYKIPTFFKLAR